MYLFRRRQKYSLQFPSQEGNLLYCNDVDSLMNVRVQDPSEWRLFIDVSKLHLKAVLLLNRNKQPFSSSSALHSCAGILLQYSPSCETHPAWRMFLAYLWRLESDHISTLFTTRLCEISLLPLWMLQPSTEMSLLNETVSTSTSIDTRAGEKISKVSIWLIENKP